MLRLSLVFVFCVPTFALADSEGQARLDALAKHYGKLPGYADEGEVRTELKLDGKPISRVQTLNLKFARPNKIDLDAGTVRLVSDGTTQTVIVNPLKTIESAPAPKVFRPGLIADNAMAAGILAGPAGFPTRLILGLLSTDGPGPLIAELAMTPKAEGERELDGVTYQILLLDSATGADLRVWMTSQDALIKFIDVSSANAPIDDPIPGVKVEILGQRWATKSVKTDAIAAGSFTFEPPKEFVKLAALADGPKPEKPLPKAEPEHKLVGKPAPDFSLTVLDGPGKTKTVTKADLAGKVVILDFWATWCGPCIAEMPDIQAMIEGYDKAKQDVVFVALSIDEEQNVRKLVEDKLKEQDLILTGRPTGMVALDTNTKVSRAYDVEAIPFVVVMDQQGIIRHVHVGLTKRAVFEQEIDALLKAK